MPKHRSKNFQEPVTRVLLVLTKDQNRKVKKLSKKIKISSCELIRRAIKQYILDWSL